MTKTKFAGTEDNDAQRLNDGQLQQTDAFLLDHTCLIELFPPELGTYTLVVTRVQMHRTTDT